MGQDSDSRNNHSKSSEDKWKVMIFENLLKGNPHEINIALEEEHKFFLSANSEIVEKHLLFEK